MKTNLCPLSGSTCPWGCMCRDVVHIAPAALCGLPCKPCPRFIDCMVLMPQEPCTVAKSAHAAQLLQELLPFTRISLQSLSCCYWQVPVSPLRRSHSKLWPARQLLLAGPWHNVDGQSGRYSCVPP